MAHFKQHTFVISWILWVRSPGLASLGPLQGHSQDVRWDCNFTWDSTEEESPPLLIWLLATFSFQFLSGCGLEFTLRSLPCDSIGSFLYRSLLLQSHQESISSQDRHYSLIQYGHIDIITYIRSPLPYSIGGKLFIDPAHTQGWGGIMQEWEYQEEGIVGTTLAHPPNRVIRQSVESPGNHGYKE